MLVHENAVVKIRKDMPLDRAACIGCGVMTGFGAVTNTAKVAAGETVAVVGYGGVGMAAINGAYVAGAARIIAVDNPVKLQLAAKLGATDLINPNDGDPVERIKDLTGGVHHALEYLGLKKPPSNALKCWPSAAPRRLSAWSRSARRSNCTVSISCASGGCKARRWAPTAFAPMYAPDRTVFAGPPAPGRLVSNKIMDEINDGFQAMKDGKVVRSVIDFRSPKARLWARSQRRGAERPALNPARMNALSQPSY